MFSTFTGNPRRPRNVNLSGQVANPFAGTSWTPSSASNATKTVSDAQAEREKRQLERQRQKAAGHIQRTWRGHRTRRNVADDRRTAFDSLYRSNTTLSSHERIRSALPLVLSFARRVQGSSDLERVLLFVRDCNHSDIRHTFTRIHPSRIEKLAHILVTALNVAHRQNNAHAEQLSSLFVLLTGLVDLFPTAIVSSMEDYFTVLARVCQSATAQECLREVIASLNAVLTNGTESAYQAFAYRFLTVESLIVFENNIASFATVVHLEQLSDTIIEYCSSSKTSPSNDEMLWALAHFIHLGQNSLNTRNLAHLNALLTQISALSSDISSRLQLKSSLSESDDAELVQLYQPFETYISTQLMCLVDDTGIIRLLTNFSRTLTESLGQHVKDTNILASYILCLLQGFPVQADNIRMKLFMAEIPTAEGETPIVKFLWQMMRQTTLLQRVVTDEQSVVRILRSYLSGGTSSGRTIEDQEWPTVLLFLELYIFILRLSDDEDFMSAIRPPVLDGDSPPSRLRSCSLSLPDITVLSKFLKNMAFALHYNAADIKKENVGADSYAKSRLDAYFGSNQAPPSQRHRASQTTQYTTLDLPSLRSKITIALKMIYDKDARNQFLPPNHWLMSTRFDQDDFIGAVIAEEQRQREEADQESDEDADADAELNHGLNSGPIFHHTAAGQRLSRNARLERLKTQQSRIQKERRLAEFGPKLEILKHMPFVVPFETRVLIFRQFIQMDRERRSGGESLLFSPFAKHHAKIRRGQCFDDAFTQFYALGEGLKDPIQITFVDQFDTPEAGIDGGGVTKEFLTSITSEAFGQDDENQAVMFTASQNGLLYPNPMAIDIMRESLRERGVSDSSEGGNMAVVDLCKRYEFLGRIVGKCMYEGILVDLTFAGFFLLKWSIAGTGDENTYKGSVNDLKDMDEDLYKGMLRLKNYDGNVSDLGIDFTIADEISAPGMPIKTKTCKLIENGDRTYVTNDNRLLYISYVARHRLVVQPATQTKYFLDGLQSIIRPHWLSMFSQSELQRLVGGDSREIDLEDLRRNTIYSGLYEIGDDGEEHPTIKMFWRVLAGFTEAEKRNMLRYVSSTPRAPLLGFSQLRPKFSIRDGGTDEERLPSTSTCVNLLKLPRYTNESTLREKLLYAITSGAGFDLS
jgi:ubiquitin-protein ligase E3 C